jgi:hypothetical protein
MIRKAKCYVIKMAKLIKKIPFVHLTYKWLVNVVERRLLNSQSTEDVFSAIHKNNSWKGDQSVSGKGSDLRQTRNVIRELPKILRDLEVRSILDVPCGDFHWMSTVQLDDIRYIGADIVPAIIQANEEAHQKEARMFMVKNLITDELPAVDLIFCRDCLVHLSFQDIRRALQNICRSDARYLMTTTFTGREANDDIATGQWRTINLELSPFSFPPPVLILEEGCEEYDGEFSDKSLGLWTLESLRKVACATDCGDERATLERDDSAR